MDKMMAAEQKMAKEMLRAEYERIYPNSKKMVDFCVNETEYVVILEDGSMVQINKPRIETEFCFGYRDDYNGDDYKNANRMADAARHSEEYFKRENLKKLDDVIDALEYRDDSKKYFTVGYYGSKCANLRSFRCTRWYDYDCEKNDPRVDVRDLSEAECDKILEGYKMVREHFEKRLNTYLKKYGTSKLRTWSYWMDA